MFLDDSTKNYFEQGTVYVKINVLLFFIAIKYPQIMAEEAEITSI